MIKGGGWIIFAGCSFTWGQGLWSYCSNTKWYVPTVNEYTSMPDDAPIPRIAEEFRKDNRFAGIVSKKYHANPIIKRWNGGTDEESIRFIDDVKRNKVHPHSLIEVNSEWDNISTIVFQTTQLYRSHFFFHHKGQEYGIRAHPGHHGLSVLDKIIRNENYNEEMYANHYSLEEQPNVDIFLDWLIDNNLKIEDFQKLHAIQMMDTIENTFKKLEKEGKSVVLLSWKDDYLDEIKKRPYFDDKFIKLEYMGETFDCIEHLMIKHPSMQIQFDNEKVHNDGGDGHPSLKCHKIIAESLIKKLDSINA